MNLQPPAQALLDAAVDGLADLAPERRYLWVGAVIDDCEQLVVSNRGISVGTPAAEIAADLRDTHGVHAKFTTFEVRWTTCVGQPDEGALSPEASTAVAAVLLEAAQDRFYSAITRAVLTGELFEACQSVSVGPLVPVDTSGGLIGWSLEVRMQV